MPQEALGEAMIPRGWRAAVLRPDSCDETSCRVPTLQASALKKIGVDPPPAAYATQGGFWFVSQLLARVFAASGHMRPKSYACRDPGICSGQTTRRGAASAADLHPAADGGSANYNVRVALEEVDEDPLLDGEAFRAHVRANRERLSRTWSVVSSK